MPDADTFDRLVHAVDGDLIVIDKPSGIPTTGHTLEDEHCVQDALIKHFGRMVWAVHQLDADTSGVCLFSQSKKLVGRIKAHWSGPLTRKVYLAIVEGEPEWEEMEAHFPIGELRPNHLGVCATGKHAHTTFEVLARSSGYALVGAELHTGRTHQVRIHLSHLGHPLVGEGWYREQPSTVHFRQALHAHRLSLPPLDGVVGRSWTVPFPEDLSDLGRHLGLGLDPVLAIQGSI